LPTNPKRRLSYEVAPGIHGHLKVTEVRNVHQVLYLADAARFNNITGASSPADILGFYQNAQAGLENVGQNIGNTPTYPGGVVRTVHARHKNRTFNALFMDGHVETVPARAFAITV